MRAESRTGGPDRPSWVDAVLGAIDRVPFGPWAFYGLYALVALAYLHLQAWLAGTAPIGTFDPIQIPHAFYIVYPLGLIHYLHRAAADAWRDYRPALDIDDDAAARLEFELIHVPGRPALLIAALAAGVVASSAADPVSGIAGTSGVVLALQVVALWVAVTTVLMLVYDVVRMLRFVSRALGLAPEVNLFKPEPLYALSRLTLRAAVGLIAIPTFQLLAVPVEININASSIAWLTMLVVAGAAAFVLPLRGIHHRIVAEKRVLEAAAGVRIQATIARLHAAADANDTTVDDTLNKRLGSLIQERELLARLPSWPWQAGTGRAFASAILLPIGIWLLTRLLGRIV